MLKHLSVRVLTVRAYAGSKFGHAWTRGKCTKTTRMRRASEPLSLLEPPPTDPTTCPDMVTRIHPVHPSTHHFPAIPPTKTLRHSAHIPVRTCVRPLPHPSPLRPSPRVLRFCAASASPGSRRRKPRRLATTRHGSLGVSAASKAAGSGSAAAAGVYTVWSNMHVYLRSEGVGGWGCYKDGWKRGTGCTGDCRKSRWGWGVWGAGVCGWG